MSGHYDDFDRALLRAGKRDVAPTSRMHARAMRAAALAGVATAAATTTTKAAAATKIGALAKAAKAIAAVKWTVVATVATVATASVGTAAYVHHDIKERERVAALLASSPAGAPAPAPTEVKVEAPSAETLTPETRKVVEEKKTIEERKTIEEKKIVAAKKNTQEKTAEAKTPGPSSALQDELHLVDAARRALASGDASSALRLADEHATRFPSGSFAVERDVIRVDALVAAGRRDEAAVRARSFVARHPAAAQAARMAKVAGTNP